MDTVYYLREIRRERERQDEKWGESNHHLLLWFSIIGEEYGKMLKAFNDYSFDNNPNHFDDVQRKAVGVAASCVAMLECIDRMIEKGMIAESGREAGKSRLRELEELPK